MGCPYRRGGRTFFSRNSGLQNQAVLYGKDAGAAAGEETVLLDPNLLSDDGTAALRTSALTEDGALLAYGVSVGGSDWFKIYVRDVATGADLEDTVDWCKFSGISWTHDNQGFFYSRYPKPAGLDGDGKGGEEKKGGGEGGDGGGGGDTMDQEAAGTEVDANKNQAVYYHRLGRPQEEDQLVYAAPEEPEWMFGAEVRERGVCVWYRVPSCCACCGRTRAPWWYTYCPRQGYTFLRLVCCHPGLFSFRRKPQS